MTALVQGRRVLRADDDVDSVAPLPRASELWSTRQQQRISTKSGANNASAAGCGAGVGRARDSVVAREARDVVNDDAVGEKEKSESEEKVLASKVKVSAASQNDNDDEPELADESMLLL